MSHEGDENLGTGLSDVLDLLVKAPSERLQSLTFQLGESPEDKIVHALCLIVLQRGAQALEKLQTLRENHLANHLAEKWQLSGGKLEEFCVHCAAFKELSGQCLAVLARMFKVLSEQKLCSDLQRNLAYKRAVSSDGRQNNLEYFQFREEAKQVCGPEFAKWMCSSNFEPYSDPPSSQNEAETHLKVSLSQDLSERGQNIPSPLQASCSLPSFPTHLEISLPPTASYQNDKKPPEPPEQPQINAPDPPVGESGAENALDKPGELISVGPSGFDNRGNSIQVGKSAEDSRKSDSLTHPTTNQTTKPTTKPKYDPPAGSTILLPEVAAVKKVQRSDSSEEEEEETFYAFVILHAPEDEEKAGSMKKRLEEAIGCEGAVFCEDFEIPGKSTLRSVEDAINNSAFTLLLLTRNFSTPMQEVEADTALVNSINKTHKYNTVIPVLPQENSITRDDMPPVLRTKNPLFEDKFFEKKAKKAMSAAAIKRQRRMWAEEQELKMQKKKQERLKQLNQHQMELLKESEAAKQLEKEKLDLQLAQERLLNPQEQNDGAGSAQLPQHPNIHIEHAQYIMIGNDSRMTVGLPGAAEESSHRDEEEEDS